MWDLANHTPFSAEAGFQRDENAAAFWCVWLKSTFTIRAGRPLQFLPDQSPLLRQSLYGQAPAKQQYLKADCDIVLPKAACDVILEGTGQAPVDHDLGQPFAVTMKVGSLSRELWVHPPRRFAQGRIAPLAHSPTTLGYADAWGGKGHPGNPIGCGAEVEANGELRLPRLSEPGQNPATGPIDPASFGAIPADWQVRAVFGGTYDAAWRRSRAPLLPRDYDVRARQSAPQSQQMCPPPQGRETVILRNIGPGAGADGTLTFALPGLQFELETRFKDQTYLHPMTMQTIRIDLHTAQLSITWAGALAVPGAHNDVRLAGSRVHMRRAEGFSVAGDMLDHYHDLFDS